ncbi:hypothetical protein NA57DRAFT_54055 [Rhizodiscina lignyota]|uniref:F-box domain-containing protein n=1 Tax=Rhizodiscina lignyota TaxID=1504668 RepID=A0A9P4IMU0_9PEZI|nr:hypothetical protein NA57DRAFT_54055 [Rhizodiscina lignyota]
MDRISALPNELLAQILTYLREHATPSLYEQAIVNIGSESHPDSFIRGLKSSSGQYVRHLVIIDNVDHPCVPTYPSEPFDDLEFGQVGTRRRRPEKFGPVVRNIIQCLHDNTLKSFRFASAEVLDSWTAQLLHKNQTKLEFVSYKLNSPVSNYFANNSTPDLRSFELIVGKRCSLDRELPVFGKLKHFALIDRSDAVQRDMYFNRLFALGLNFKELVSIRLVGMGLGMLTPTLGVDSLPSMRSIVLRHCTGESHFLHDISNMAANSKLQLKSFELTMSSSRALTSRHTRDAARRFLESFTGLESLLLFLDTRIGDAIAHHRDSLRKLVLFDQGSDDRDETYDVLNNRWERCLNTCPHLEQLGISYPLDLHRWRDELDKIFTGILGVAPELKTLCLHNTSNNGCQKPASTAFRLSQELAPHLKVISFAPVSSGGMARQKHFVKHMQRLPWSSTEQPVAFHCPAAAVKYVEPTSDILEYEPWDERTEYHARRIFGYRSFTPSSYGCQFLGGAHPRQGTHASMSGRRQLHWALSTDSRCNCDFQVFIFGPFNIDHISQLPNEITEEILSYAIIHINREELFTSFIHGVGSISGRHVRSLVILDDPCGHTMPKSTLDDFMGLDGPVFGEHLLVCDAGEMQFRVKMILQSLHRDTLRAFRFASWRALNNPNLSLLENTQGRLEYFSTPLMWWSPRSYTSRPDSCLHSLETVINEHTLPPPLLHVLDNLRHFSLVVSRAALYSHDTFVDSAMPLGGLLGRGSLDSLTSIQLIGVNLVALVHPLGTDLLPALRSLVIRRCRHVIPLLNDLVNLGVHNNLHLQKFELSMDEPIPRQHQQQNNLSDVLEDFFESFTGLEELMLYLDALSILDSIKIHGKTLRRLAIFGQEPANPSDETLNSDHLREYLEPFLQCCPLLEQLGIPLMLYRHEMIGEWCLESIVRSLLNLTPHLTTLYFNDNTSATTQVVAWYRRFASLTFRCVQEYGLAPKLGVISFRASNMTWHESSFPQQIFVPQKQKRPWTPKERLVAFPCPREMAKYIEPASEILDYEPWESLSERCVRTPFRYRSLSLPKFASDSE